MLSYLFGSKTPATTQENQNPELAMREALDAHGDFQTSIDGALEFKDFCVLRSVIIRQANRLHSQKKEEMSEQLYKFFTE
jgi:hypothetical protein